MILLLIMCLLEMKVESKIHLEITIHLLGIRQVKGILPDKIIHLWDLIVVNQIQLVLIMFL